MIRHRVTFFNPTSSNDDVIKSVAKEKLELPALANFPREDKYVVPGSTLPGTIKLLRVQWKQNYDNRKFALKNPLFVESDYQQLGLQIYAVPASGADTAQFFEDLNSFVSGSVLDGGAVAAEDWVVTSTSVFLSLREEAIPAKLARYLTSSLLGDDVDGEKEGLPALLDNSDSIDLVLSQESKTLKTYALDGSRLAVAGVNIFARTSPSVKHEIGIFMLDNEVTSIDDIMLSGVRFVIDPSDDDPDDKLHKTLFHVKPRHRKVPDVTYETTLKDPIGLHPTLQFSFSNDTVSALTHLTTAQGVDTNNCKLFYYQLLPKSFFIDKYQLPKNFSLVALHGDSDLEAPEYTVDGWGSEALIEIASDKLEDFEFTIHSRYQLPTADLSESASVPKHINTPSIFYACDVVQDPRLLGTSPFDYTTSLASNVGGGFQTYFTEDTAFYHVQPTVSEDSGEELQLSIPRAQGDPHEVNYYTLLVLGLGIAWLSYRCFSIFLSRSKKVTPEKKNE